MPACAVSESNSARPNIAHLTDHWISTVNLAEVRSQARTPVFIYSEAQLIKNIRRVKAAYRAAGLEGRVSIFVPFFPNANPHIMKPLYDEGAGLLLQMPNEYELVTRYGLDRFIISPGHVSDQELSYWSLTGHRVFLASLDEIAFAIQQNAPTISARIDSLCSDKPGIKVEQLGRLAEMLSASGRALECFEVYCGSGNSLQDMVNIVRQIFQMFVEHFPTAKSINFAGGHGFDYGLWGETQKHFDWEQYFSAIRDLAIEMQIPKSVNFLFEPGRDVLADAGVLLTSVKRDIVHHSNGDIVVTDGSRMLMPSAQLRKRAHNTVFLDTNFQEIADYSGSGSVKVRGRTLLRNDYILPGEVAVPASVKAGDYLLILDVGAYCATQHMEFLNVPPAGEVLVAKDGHAYLVTKPGDESDKWRNLLPERQPLSAV
ncbi:diaminopimelate decarboxylase [Paraburkholderia hayleyella]|uniref:diaminopimelate decarboxylase n=1 Tax=Paraburkholderia hayleyella TaxID=2152889 RepID=UPI0012923C50|nr:diaminopimelate decarboxylase [Paraburkholderia hayleyella]